MVSLDYPVLFMIFPIKIAIIFIYIKKTSFEIRLSKHNSPLKSDNLNSKIVKHYLRITSRCLRTPIF